MTKKVSGEKISAHSRRPVVRLQPPLEEAMSCYTRVALAASVGLMAIARSAEAKIVYTPAKIPIAVNGGPLFLDLNHDGIADFILSNVFRTPSSAGFPSFATLLVSASGVTRNQVWGTGSKVRFASVLPGGVSVGANKAHLRKSPTDLMARLIVDFHPSDREVKANTYCSTWWAGCSSFVSGQWLNKKSRYLGLKFVIKKEVHYGWARATVKQTSKRRGDTSITATRTVYAYETIPNKPIITGKTEGPDVITLPLDVRPLTLGRLAAGRR
jgi:hypothetical protein